MNLDWLSNTAYFIVLIGALIFFHELGHFLAAKLFHVKVLKFALGFGRPLLSIHWGETIYAINLFPLGGYVKMLGQEPAELRSPEEAPAPEDAARAFDAKPRWQRALIILAGPVFNLLLPLPVFYLLFAAQHQLQPATIGSVIAHDPAWRAGIKAGDRIVAIDGEPIRYWEEMEARIKRAPDQQLAVTVLRQGLLLQLQVTPRAALQSHPLKQLGRTVGLIGVTSEFLASQIGVLGPTTPAGLAGLRTWDLVVQAGGRDLIRWVELEQVLAEHAGREVELTVRRFSDEEKLPSDPAELAKRGAEVKVRLRVPPGGTPQAAGLAAGEYFIRQVEADGAAEQAGLQVGDQLMAVDGEPCATFETCLRHFRQEHDQPHTVVFRRPGADQGQQEVRFQAKLEKKINDIKQEEIHARIGLANRTILLPSDPVPNADRWSRALLRSTIQSWDMLVLNGYGLVLLATGQISGKNVGGPIMIFDLTTKAAQRGWEDFLWLLAMISINLGLINLLPIPILDGGQITVLGIETIRRGPLSLKARTYAAYVGLGLVILLMVYAFKNDLERYWSTLTQLFQ